MVVGRDRLQSLREQVSSSQADLAIIEQTRQWAPLHAFVFRGRNDDGSGYWRLDEQLDAAESSELCSLMFRSHLPLKRALLDAGSLDNIYIEWGRRETSAFESGLRRLRETLRHELRSAPADSREARLLRLDLWLSDRISLFSGASLDDVLQTLLPPRMARREERLARVKPLFVDP